MLDREPEAMRRVGVVREDAERRSLREIRERLLALARSPGQRAELHPGLEAVRPQGEHLLPGRARELGIALDLRREARPQRARRDRVGAGLQRAVDGALERARGEVERAQRGERLAVAHERPGARDLHHAQRQRGQRQEAPRPALERSRLAREHRADAGEAERGRERIEAQHAVRAGVREHGQRGRGQRIALCPSS